MPTIHHFTDSEIVHMVVSAEKNGNEEDVRERISIDRLIKNCNHFLLQFCQGTKRQ